MNDILDGRALDNLEALLDRLEAMAEAPCEEPGLSDIDHALQTAFELRRLAPDDEALQVAGLVHDIAHGLCHIRDHEAVGMRMLRRIMPERVVRLVGVHAEAKRYLVATDPAYLAKLSPDSQASLLAQGGAMRASEVANFAALPLKDAAVQLRIADDRAKTPGRIVPGLEAWREPLARVCASQTREF